MTTAEIALKAQVTDKAINTARTALAAASNRFSFAVHHLAYRFFQAIPQEGLDADGVYIALIPITVLRGVEEKASKVLDCLISGLRTGRDPEQDPPGTTRLFRVATLFAQLDPIGQLDEIDESIMASEGMSPANTAAVRATLAALRADVDDAKRSLGLKVRDAA